MQFFSSVPWFLSLLTVYELSPYFYARVIFNRMSKVILDYIGLALDGKETDNCSPSQ